ncbi:MAG: hypothetical protein R8G66_19445 [Cytophagales bacterium]|nr:hypothetical protein [Cytophagales bacterium]
MKKLLILFFCVHTISELSAQDFDQFPSLSGDIAHWYKAITTNSEAPLMNGTYYYDEHEELISQYHTPFYKTGWDYYGQITYEGRLFPRVDIIYNTSEDLLLIRNLNMEKAGERSLLIKQSKIDSFTIHNDKFLRFTHAKIGSAGFYKLIIRGKSMECFAKESKTGQPAGTVFEFNPKTNFYIKYKDEIHPYRQKGSLYKIFPAHRKEIKKYIRENSLFILSRKKKEVFLRSILNYCDSIVK